MQTKSIVENASIAKIDLAGEQAEISHLRAQLEYAVSVANQEEARLIRAAFTQSVSRHLRHLASGNVIVARAPKATVTGASAGLPLRGLPARC